MLETLDGGHGTSHSDGLVPFLGRQKGLQLVFFNGCSSQEQAMELSEAGVLAVVGTATYCLGFKKKLMLFIREETLELDF